MTKTPAIVLFYGLAGLIPFFAAPVATLLAPDFRWQFNEALLWWAAIILSFLGGARWGAAVQTSQPAPGLIGLAMLPSIIGWLVLLAPAKYRVAQLLALAGALLLHLAWDWRANGLPGWYGRLRLTLTAGAVTALGWQAALQG
ncbi:DUF3429 domain-containing protein [Sandarakinorhabdus oryzae]|uniref:DUF3429 domain-containing protein n=1 Tax=Sandarakinorhabdus oryzae TaxID=2675220 RepID=UPI0012E0F0A5|nr:DUF3429 domain-containing protein [Sandarakinorhabdus oryzae]